MTRERNGWVDAGRALNNRRCPNCGSTSFRETLSREHCPACGLECDYWGKGSNAVYDAMIERDERKEEVRRQRESEEEFDRWYGHGCDD